MPSRARFLLAAALVAAVAATPYAQQATAPAQTTPVFRSGVDLVRLDVRVTDNQGRPIRDLKPDEVQITDAGSNRPVLLFQHIAESGRSWAESAERTVAAEVSTNQGAPRGQLYVLLFDQLHITAGTELKVRQAAERFLREHVRPQDRVAIYGLPAPGPALAFTSNIHTAIDQLGHVHGGLERMVTTAIGDITLAEAYRIARGDEALMQQFMSPSGTSGTNPRTSAFADQLLSGKNGLSPDDMRRMISDNARIIANQADTDSRTFLRMAAGVMRDLRAADGRKTVMLFTEGFYGDNLTREVQDVAAAAAETYSVVYAFDLNRRVENLTGEAQGGDQIADANSRLEPIGDLANETNGALVMDALGHLDQAMNELGDANTDYYILGFQPSADAVAHRESYEHVNVKVSRPGATVSTRTGYSAGVPLNLADKRKTIDASLGAPFSQQGLKVEYTTYVSQADLPSLDRVVVSLQTELPVSRGPDTEPADIVFVVRNSRTGQVAASGSDRIPLPVASSPGSATGQGDWHVQFSLAPGDYLMRCVVREPGGLLGSADRHFTARALAGADVAASDLVLRSREANLPVRAQVYTSEPLVGAVRVYARTSGQLSDLTGRIELMGLNDLTQAAADTPIIAVNAALGDTMDTGSESVRDVMFSVPLDHVPAGEYVARARISSRGETIADVRRQVHVIEGVAPVRMAEVTTTRPRDVIGGSVAQRIIEAGAESRDSAVHRAIDALHASRWSDALAALTEAPAADAHVRPLRGVTLMALERYDAALTELTAAFAAEPNNATVAFVMGWAAVGAGDDRVAIGAFRNAALRDPSMVPAHLALAEAYVRLNQPALAAQALETGLTSVPSSVELKTMLDRIRR